MWIHLQSFVVRLTASMAIEPVTFANSLATSYSIVKNRNLLQISVTKNEHQLQKVKQTVLVNKVL